MLGVVIVGMDYKRSKLYLEDLEAIFSENTEKSFEVSLSEKQFKSLQELFGTDSLIGKKAFIDERSKTLHFDFVFRGEMRCIQQPTSSYR